MSTAFLNMAVCHHLLKNPTKAVENCKKSLTHKKSIKAYYRMGQGYKALKNFDEAIKAFKQAIMMDTEDPNDIQSELKICQRLEKA